VQKKYQTSKAFLKNNPCILPIFIKVLGCGDWIVGA